jgi:PAS domain S-box-containing protein
MHGRVPLQKAKKARPAMLRGYNLRAHLGVLVAAALLPAVILGILVLVDNDTAYRQVAEARASGNAAALAQAIARDQQIQRALVQALVELPEADDPEEEIGDFEAVARRLAAPIDGWVVLVDVASGRQLVNTRLPRGAEMPPPLVGPSAGSLLRETVLRSGGMVTSNLLAGQRLPEPFLAVMAPVVVDGRVTRIVALMTMPKRLSGLLREAVLGEGAVATLVDAGGTVVARSLDDARWRGTHLAQWRAEDARRARVFEHHSLDGTPALIATQPVAGMAGWYVGITQPWSRFGVLQDAAFLKPLLGAVATMVLGTLLVLWFAGRIARPVEALAADAARDADDAATPGAAEKPRSGIRELDALADQVVRARETLRRRAREAEDQTALMGSVMDAAAEPVFAKNLSLEFVIANRAAWEAMGGSHDKLIGRRTAEVGDPVLAPVSEAHDRAVIATGQPWTGEQDVSTKLGRRIFMTTKVPWRDASGRIIGIVAVAHDRTHAREVERRLAAAQARLLQVSRLDATGAMAAGLAHEINQPLTAVSNYANAATRLLGDPGTPVPPWERIEEVRRVLPNVTAQARRAGAILSRLRGFISDGATELRDEPVEEVLQDAAAIAAATLAREEAQLELDLCPPLGSARIDRVQLQQVLFNLLRNAAEAMRDSPVRHVRLSAWRAVPGAKGDLVIEVADSGPGLPDEVRAQLFEPFVTTKPDGLGVGLAICRRVVEAQGGVLETGTAPEGGALFRIRLPDGMPPDGLLADGLLADAAGPKAVPTA